MTDALFDVKIKGRNDALWKPRKAFDMGEIYSLYGNWGKMEFHHIPRPMFDIWLNRYRIIKAIRTETQINQPFIEMSFLMSRSALIALRQFGVFILEQFQYNLIYAPYIDSRVGFERGTELITVDFHFNLRQIEELADAFPELIDPLLEKIIKNRVHAVFPINGFASEAMIKILTKLIRSIFNKNERLIGADTIDGMVNGLLYEVLASGGHMVFPRLNLEARNGLKDIKKRLFYYPNLKVVVPDLIKEVGLCRTHFDLAFRELSNMSIFKYGLKCKMEWAYKWLSEKNGLNITEIAYKLGYQTVQSFSKAFEQWYGFRPSQLK